MDCGSGKNEERAERNGELELPQLCSLKQTDKCRDNKLQPPVIIL